MKKVLLTILAAVVILGVLAGVGYAGYRIGYIHSPQSTGNPPPFFNRHFEPFDQNRMPMRSFGKEFERGFGPGGSQMMHRGRFGFFSPFMFLGRLIVYGFIIWLIYWLFTKSGWRLTRQSVEYAKAETKEEKS